jgi:hypothetical protein
MGCLHMWFVYPLVDGSSPMYALCQGLAVPTVAAGVSYTGSKECAPDENIRLENLNLGIKFIGHLLERSVAHQNGLPSHYGQPGGLPRVYRS